VLALDGLRKVHDRWRLSALFTPQREVRRQRLGLVIVR
jgi:hypothetical protein